MSYTTYRDQGAVGALLDEYERALDDLHQVIDPVTSKDLTTIVDHETKDPDCVSIQTILTHVVRAGYGYATAIRKWMGESIDYKAGMQYTTVAEYRQDLQDMFSFTERVFMDFPDIKLEENEEAKKIHVRWGQTYDVEQLMEHAIVHILRHRRQIERFLLRLKD